MAVQPGIDASSATSKWKWSGWNDDEKNDIICEFEINREVLTKFHVKVAKAHFRWWSCVPVLGCITAPSRYRSMKESIRKLNHFAASSHIAVTSIDVIIVSSPPEEDDTRRTERVSILAGLHVDSNS